MAKLLNRVLCGLILGASLVTSFAEAAIAVPPGNRNEIMPDLPNTTINRRTSYVRGRSFDDYFVRALNSLNDKNLRPKILNVARIYGVPPEMIIAAIAGEKTFNVSTVDSAQTLALSAATWAGKWALRFSSNEVDLITLVKEPIMANCMAQRTDYYKWECVRVTWESQLRGRVYNGVRMPAKSFRTTFFNPLSKGFTYGLGQLDPIKALMFSDVCARLGGLPPLTIDDPVAVYTAIIDPDLTLHYVAALVRNIIEVYASVGGFDISQNAGVVATLYNVGFELQRAQKIANANRKSRGQVIYPEENYYGWAINAKIEDIRAVVNGTWRGVSQSNVSLDRAADAAIARQNGVAPEADDTAGGINLFDFGRPRN